jgi:protein-tyrosine phosphatase
VFEHILVLCTGNVCRSPLGAALLKKKLPDKHIESAGLAALTGSPADESFRHLAQMDAIELHAHKARQVTQQMLLEADLILVMSESQHELLAQTHPIVTGKTLLFGRWLFDSATGKQGVEIPDPYQKSKEAFQYVYAVLNEAADSWHAKLNAT